MNVRLLTWMAMAMLALLLLSATADAAVMEGTVTHSVLRNWVDCSAEVQSVSIWNGSREVTVSLPRRRLSGSRHGLPPAEAFYNGRGVRVTYHADSWRGDVEADDVEFTGRDAPGVYEADQLVRHHYRLLHDGRYKEAYDDFSPAWKQSQSYGEFVEGARHSKYRVLSIPQSAIRVVHYDAREVMLQVRTGCFVDTAEREHLFTFVRTRQGWRIDRVVQTFAGAPVRLAAP